MEAEPINSIGPGQYGDRHLQYDLGSQMMEHRGMTAETSLPLRQQCITPQQLSSKWSIERRVTQSTCAFHRRGEWTSKQNVHHRWDLYCSLRHNASVHSPLSASCYDCVAHKPRNQQFARRGQRSEPKRKVCKPYFKHLVLFSFLGFYIFLRNILVFSLFFFLFFFLPTMRKSRDS